MTKSLNVLQAIPEDFYEQLVNLKMEKSRPDPNKPEGGQLFLSTSERRRFMRDNGVKAANPLITRKKLKVTRGKGSFSNKDNVVTPDYMTCFWDDIITGSKYVQFQEEMIAHMMGFDDN